MISDANRRIVRNTVMLYVRIFFAQVIALYTSRKVLEVLGLEDFGIQTAVGGVLGMLCMLNGSMSAATSRYLTIELSRNDMQTYNRFFSMSLVIHAILALAIIVAAESVGLWFVNEHLVIPPDRMVAANWVYQLSVIGVVLSIMQTPYIASITAHEHMGIYAYVGIGQSVAYLLVVIGLSRMGNVDLLIAYVLLMLGVQICEIVIYVSYCRHHFKYCRYKHYWDKGTFKSMFGFTGWNMFGTVAWSLKSSGTGILLNQFGGPIANAAAGIGGKVSGAVNSLVAGFSTAINPQITKSYGSDSIQRMHRLIFSGTKLQCLILAIAIVPISVEIEYLLNLWLVEVPPHTVWFVRLILLDNICCTLGSNLITGLMATGRIKLYQICIGSIMLLNIPISYLLLMMGMKLETIFIVSISITMAAHGGRLLFARSMLHLSIKQFIFDTFLPCIIIIGLSYAIIIGLHIFLSTGITRLSIVGIIGALSIITFTYCIGLNTTEKEFVNHVVVGHLNHPFFKQIVQWKRKKLLG